MLARTPPPVPAPSTMTPLLEPHSHCALIWNDERMSYTELLGRARHWSHLIPEAGTHVIVFSENSPAWVCCAYAIWSAHAVLVPVDYLSTAEELTYVIDDCEATLVVCSRRLMPTVERSLRASRHDPSILILDELAVTESSSGNNAEGGALTVDESALAAIVYTSGTTGEPKGVMLSFGNILTNVRAVVKEGYFTPEARVLLLLPLHHVLPLAGSLVAPLFSGATIVFATSLAGDELLSLLRRHAITTLVGVPRFYDVLHRALTERIKDSLVARTLFIVARRIRSRAFSHLVFRSVHSKFGGALKHLICGGAALSPETAETFAVLGFDMCEGYGMTECSPMITFPRLHRLKLGSCGQVLDGCEVRIAEGGEILARGPNVMQGYYNRPRETQALVYDGWLHTGDLGYLDEEGYLYVTGRLKDTLVLANGKKVNPSTIEAGLQTAPAVREAGVFLDGDALHALIVPNWDRVPIAEREVAETWLRREVLAPYNATVSPYRRVARLTLVDDELPRTRLGKLRRHQLAAIAEHLARVPTEASDTAMATDGAVACLIAFFERQGRQPVNAASRLSADLGLDSLGRVELSVFIQRTFAIAIPETRFLELETVSDLARFVDRYKKEQIETPIEVSWAEILNPKTPPTLPTSSVYHHAIAYVSRVAVRTVFRIKSHGRERVPAGPFILVANHQSYLDGLFVCAYLRPHEVLRTLFYAKEQHVRKPWLRFLARRCNTIIMNPKEGFLVSLQQLATGLKRGNNLILFPEGTRSRDGVLGPFKDSYAVLASELHVPIVPVVIDGAYAVLPALRRFPNFRQSITVTYLEAMRPDAGELATSFNVRVRTLIAEALETKRRTP